MEQDIIMTGLQSWDLELGGNSKNIALEFSKNHRVLFVNPPAGRFTSLRYRLRGNKLLSLKGPALRKINDNLWVFTPRKVIESIGSLRGKYLFDILNIHNNRIFSGEIKKMIHHLNFKRFILFCDNDIYRSFYLKDFLNPDIYIYYSRDNLVAVDYWKTHGLRLEPGHMAKADLILANSQHLAKQASKYNPESYYIGQGCDLSEFDPAKEREIPMELKNIRRPVIGYTGVLNSSRLNIGLLEHIAINNPDWNLVLVGPEDEHFLKSDLHNLKNVLFTGNKSAGLLPAFIANFDVAINPQKINDITIGNYPRKIDEYLAMGKPVVATPTKAMSPFKPHVSLALTKEEWIEAIQCELSGDNEQLKKNRIKLASTHSWQNNVREIMQRVTDYKKAGRIKVIPLSKLSGTMSIYDDLLKIWT